MTSPKYLGSKKKARKAIKEAKDKEMVRLRTKKLVNDAMLASGDMELMSLALGVKLK